MRKVHQSTFRRRPIKKNIQVVDGVEIYHQYLKRIGVDPKTGEPLERRG